MSAALQRGCAVGDRPGREDNSARLLGISGGGGRKLPKCFLAPLCDCGRARPALARSFLVSVVWHLLCTDSDSALHCNDICCGCTRTVQSPSGILALHSSERVAGRLHKYAILDCATSLFRSLNPRMLLQVRKNDFHGEDGKFFVESSLPLHSQKLAHI